MHGNKYFYLDAVLLQQKKGALDIRILYPKINVEYSALSYTQAMIERLNLLLQKRKCILADRQRFLYSLKSSFLKDRFYALKAVFASTLGPPFWTEILELWLFLHF